MWSLILYVVSKFKIDSGLNKVVPDWVQVQSFVSVQIRSFFLDMDGLKNFSWEILGLFL